MLWWQVQSAFGRYGTYYNLHSQTKCLVVVVADSFFHIHFVLVVDPIIGISALRSQKKEIVRRGIHSPKKKNKINGKIEESSIEKTRRESTFLRVHCGDCTHEVAVRQGCCVANSLTIIRIHNQREQKKKQTKTNHDNVDRFLWCVKRRRLTKATTSESSQLFFRIPAAQHRLYCVPSATRGTRAVQWIHALLGTQVGAWCIHNMNMSIEFIGYQTDISVMFVCVICFCFCISSHIYKPA